MTLNEPAGDRCEAPGGRPHPLGAGFGPAGNGPSGLMPRREVGGRPSASRCRCRGGCRERCSRCRRWPGRGRVRRARSWWSMRLRLTRVLPGTKPTPSFGGRYNDSPVRAFMGTLLRRPRRLVRCLCLLLHCGQPPRTSGAPPNASPMVPLGGDGADPHLGRRHRDVLLEPGTGLRAAGVRPAARGRGRVGRPPARPAGGGGRSLAGRGPPVRRPHLLRRLARLPRSAARPHRRGRRRVPLRARRQGRVRPPGGRLRSPTTRRRWPSRSDRCSPPARPALTPGPRWTACRRPRPLCR